MFYTLWNETRIMKEAGVKVMGMIGGAAPGSFTSETLDGDEDVFEKYYTQIREVIFRYELDGLDIDVEQPMSQDGIERLIDKIHCDFGSGFIITLAPVASALKNGGNLSGLDYKLLEYRKGCKISFYNCQFYGGFGTMSSTKDYHDIVTNGFKASRVVAGQLSSGTLTYDRLGQLNINTTIVSLREKYGRIGGIMGWEYGLSVTRGMDEPWRWAQAMTQILRPKFLSSRATADQLGGGI
ncbi:endo-N-acetyl-beta-D-glucosaminidase precursor [Metarhizium anisopliae]|nr:endo-N-acetyl-beta-D-glucosaminidase D3 (chitinase) [Metarhizium anisopliae]KFG84006.1 endo-N-acetyl-beta-D-glucosaminidase precursor [Metarhizium anisopliae]